MKLSKSFSQSVESARYLEIIQIYVWTPTNWVERYAIRVHGIYGGYCQLLKSWKTVRGAYGAACDLRPDLVPVIDSELLLRD